MSLSRRKKHLAAIAGAAVFSLTLAACSSSGDTTATDGASGDTSAPAGDITLTVATFNDFGYTDALLQEYMDSHPGVTVVQNKAATSNDARTNYFAKLGSGGLADVEAIEVDWLPEVMQYSDLLVDLSDPSVDGRWLDWKTAAATDADGRLIGYGTDIGPEAICYDGAKFEAAGMSSDPADVAAMLEGGWDTYYSVGEDYVAATGQPWFDGAGATYQGVVNQIEAAYEDPATGEVIAADNPDVKAAYDSVTAASADLSAHLSQWSDDWFAALGSSGFATMLCPGWMLGVIQGAAPDTTTWQVADVFPGGGGNWGGSYLTVPASGANTDAAKELAAWLTAPEQQLKALAAAGTFPSQVGSLSEESALNEAFAAPGADGTPSKAVYFNSDTLGTIFSNRANAITVSPYKGEFYFQINDAMQQALTRVEDGSMSASESWDQFIADVNAVG